MRLVVTSPCRKCKPDVVESLGNLWLNPHGWCMLHTKTIGKPAGKMGNSGVSKHGVLENALFIGDFPIETPLNRVDLQLPRLITGG